MERDSIYKTFQEICRQVPVVILGSGVSCEAGLPGMWELAKHLLKEFPKDINDTWSEISGDLQKGVDLETAIDNNQPDENVRKEITKIVGRYIVEKDKEIKDKYYSSSQAMIPVEKLINYFKSQILNIITPNYDCLVEYCCDKLGTPVNTGFVGYFRKSYDYEKSKRSMLHIENSTIKRVKRIPVARTQSHVNLFKLHGSLDWYEIDGKIVSDLSLAVDRNFDDKRLIIAPGKSKYEEGSKNPHRELIARADDVIRSGNSFLMIGYGFNDKHLQEYLVNRLKDDEKQGIIITRTFSDQAKELLSKCPNLWGICRKNRSSMIYHDSVNNPYELKNSEIWNIDKFVEEVLGG